MGTILHVALRHGLALLCAAASFLRLAHSDGLCHIGKCINCMSCAGDCFSKCMYFTKQNMCCCDAPPGFFAQGYGAIPCPGGTYQDTEGSAGCKSCNATSSVLYNLTIGGATDLVDCQR